MGMEVPTKIEWTVPMSQKTLCVIYGLEYPKDRNKMAKWLKNGTIRNKKFSRTEWCVHIEDLPVGYVIQFIVEDFAIALAKAFTRELFPLEGLENANISQDKTTKNP